MSDAHTVLLSIINIDFVLKIYATQMLMSALRELMNANRSVSTLMGLTCVLVDQDTDSLQMDTTVQVRILVTQGCMICSH